MPEDAKPDFPAETDPLLGRLESFFSDPDFTSAVSDFMGSRASSLELRPLEEEQSLATFAAFTEYTRMIEEKLEAFVEKEGMSTDDLMNECRRVKEIGDAASLVSVDFLLAAVEYTSFLRLVADFQGMDEWGVGSELGDLGDDGAFEDTEAYYRVDGVELGDGDDEEGLWDEPEASGAAAAGSTTTGGAAAGEEKRGGEAKAGEGAGGAPGKQAGSAAEV